MLDEIYGLLLKCFVPPPRRNLNYFSNAYAAAVSAVDPDAGNGELCIKVPSELWKHVDGKIPKIYLLCSKIMFDSVSRTFTWKLIMSKL